MSNQAIIVNIEEWKFLNSIDGLEIDQNGHYSAMVDDFLYDVKTHTKDARWFLSEFLAERAK